MKSILTIAIALPLALLACDQGPKVTAEELMAVDQAFSDYSVEHGYYEAFATYLAKGAVALNGGRQPIIGIDAILADMEGGGGTLEWRPVAGDVAKSGDLGYTWGRYTLTYEDENGDTQVAHGKYITVWKRQPDGSFKAVLDGGNPNPPPEE